MNNITNELFKQFVQSLLDDECGINEEAYELLNEIIIIEFKLIINKIQN